MGNQHSSSARVGDAADDDDDQFIPSPSSPAYLLPSPVPSQNCHSLAEDTVIGRTRPDKVDISPPPPTAGARKKGHFSRAIRSQSFISDSSIPDGKKLSALLQKKNRRYSSFDLFSPSPRNSSGSNSIFGSGNKNKRGNLERWIRNRKSGGVTICEERRPTTGPLFSSPSAALLEEPVLSVVAGPKNLEVEVSAEDLVKMTNMDKFAKYLAQVSRALDKSIGDDKISRVAFEKYVASHSPIGEVYVWDFFVQPNVNPSSVKASAFVQGAGKLFAAITDKEQINFYVKLFSRGKDIIDREAFVDLLISSYQLSSTGASQTGRDLTQSQDFPGKEWIEAVAKSCFHKKEEMSVSFVANWISINLPRIFYPMHKYYVHQLTTGYTRLSQMKDSPKMKYGKKDEPSANGGNASGSIPWINRPDTVLELDPILVWFLLASLPQTFISVIEATAQPENVKPLNRMNSKDLLFTLLNNETKVEPWSVLYDSSDQGMSINRFQHHVFNYRGPTLMMVNCDDDYTFLVGVDCEWKESSQFWGGEQCSIIQLKPEFRIVEKGAKCIFANFTIRGYPLGIQAGRDPKNISLEIKTDFEYVYFKKIPCRIQTLIVYGCGFQQAKMAQVEHKKWEAKESERLKKVNLNAGDWKENPDKYLLELAGNYKSYGS